MSVVSWPKIMVNKENWNYDNVVLKWHNCNNYDDADRFCSRHRRLVSDGQLGLVWFWWIPYMQRMRCDGLFSLLRNQVVSNCQCERTSTTRLELHERLYILHKQNDILVHRNKVMYMDKLKKKRIFVRMNSKDCVSRVTEMNIWICMKFMYLVSY